MSPFFVEKTCFSLINVGLMSIKQLNKERQPLESIQQYWFPELHSKKLAKNSDEERRFMYKFNQGHLTVFCIVFV